jgi:hypothetical protein
MSLQKDGRNGGGIYSDCGRNAIFGRSEQPLMIVILLESIFIIGAIWRRHITFPEIYTWRI